MRVRRSAYWRAPAPERDHPRAPSPSPMSEAIIVLEGLEKRYGSIRALEGLTLALPPGPTGLLGRTT